MSQSCDSIISGLSDQSAADKHYLKIRLHKLFLMIKIISNSMI